MDRTMDGTIPESSIGVGGNENRWGGLIERMWYV
jgi:hypothetical protein